MLNHLEPVWLEDLDPPPERPWLNPGRVNREWRSVLNRQDGMALALAGMVAAMDAGLLSAEDADALEDASRESARLAYRIAVGRPTDVRDRIEQYGPELAAHGVTQAVFYAMIALQRGDGDRADAAAAAALAADLPWTLSGGSGSAGATRLDEAWRAAALDADDIVRVGRHTNSLVDDLSPRDVHDAWEAAVFRNGALLAALAGSGDDLVVVGSIEDHVWL